MAETQPPGRKVDFRGNLGSPPRAHTFEDGTKAISFSVAETPRVEVDGEWVDGDTVWHQVEARKSLAANGAVSLKKGVRVHVEGYEHEQQYEREGETQSRLVVRATELDISLRFNALEVRPAVQLEAPSPGLSVAG
jgi:single-stranded DNA-binding protein